MTTVQQGTYDTSKHPEVQTGRRTGDDVLEEFVSTFEGEVKDGKVVYMPHVRYNIK